MTGKLYYNEDFDGKFFAFVTEIFAYSQKKAAVLDKNGFFPEGGGQPGDRGKIGPAVVTDTVIIDGKECCIFDGELETGREYECEIDKKFHESVTTKHSGEHIFSGICHRLFGCDNVGFHMDEDTVTVDFNRELSAEDIEKIEDGANEIVRKNVKINCFFPTADELEKLDFRFKKEIDGDLRICEIPGADICACCGTHLKNTGSVGLIKAVDFLKHRGGTRITLVIGEDALRDYRMKHSAVRSAAALFSVKPDELPKAAEKFIAKTGELKLENAALKKKIFELLTVKARRLGDSAYYIGDDIAPSDAMPLCDLLSQNAAVALVFIKSDGGYRFALCAKSDVSALTKELTAALCGRGGGRGNSSQGAVSADEREIENFIRKKFENV